MIGQPDAVSILIEPPEALRDATVETIRRALYAQRDEILEQICITIAREFTSKRRDVGSIQDAILHNEIEAAKQHASKIAILKNGPVH